MQTAVIFKISEQDKNILKRLAKKERMGMSAYIRQKVLSNVDDQVL